MNNPPYFRVISDVHGFLDERASLFGRSRNYLSLIKDVSYSVQLGDFGIIPFIPADGRVSTNVMEGVDAERHKIILGNHDKYDIVLPHYLGDFGKHAIPLREGTFDFFYMRGAYSIDKAWRTIGISWWPQEELDWQQGNAAVQAYVEMKPRTVFTHECPEEIIYLMGKIPVGSFHPSRTHQYLQAMVEQHRPELWIFGHHHVNWVGEYKGTVFMCLAELAYVDFDEDGQLMTKKPQ